MTGTTRFRFRTLSIHKKLWQIGASFNRQGEPLQANALGHPRPLHGTGMDHRQQREPEWAMASWERLFGPGLRDTVQGVFV